jgi:hypothetical protein
MHCHAIMTNNQKNHHLNDNPDDDCIRFAVARLCLEDLPPKDKSLVVLEDEAEVFNAGLAFAPAPVVGLSDNTPS